MKKKELEIEQSILKEAKEKIQRYKNMSLISAIDIQFLERFVDEYTILAVKAKKQEKQIRLLKILLDRKG